MARQGTWSRQFDGAARCVFSPDEKQAVVAKADSLYFIALGTSRIRAQPIISYQFPASGEGRWIAYRQSSQSDLYLEDLVADTIGDLGFFPTYGFDNSGNYLVLEDSTRLEVRDLHNPYRQWVWTGGRGDTPANYCWDSRDQNLAFVVKGEKGGLWNWNIGGKPIEVAPAHISGPVVFSGNGKWLFYLTPTGSHPAITVDPETGPLIRTWQDKDLGRPHNTTPAAWWSVAATDGSRIQMLEGPDRRLLSAPSMVTGDWVLISEGHAYALLSLTDGSLRPIAIGNGYPENFCFSPGGRWFIYYDPGKTQYISCDLGAGVFRTITAGLPRGVSSEFPHGVDPEAVASPAGWIDGDSAVLLYDNYDCWAVDPGGHQRPSCFTNGYGWRHRIKLRPVAGDAGMNSPRVFSTGDTLVLTGFNVRNKHNGFFRIVAGRSLEPDSLFMGPYMFYRASSQQPDIGSWDDGMRPQKAAKASVWLVMRESAEEAPNYFWTTDLRHYHRITDIQPQKSYNWLKAELIDYRGLDGTPYQGVLYKLENFDPRKRYPLLFSIYEQLSHRLYQFPPADLCRDNINIPWFVSRGYLVFTPDIDSRNANRYGRTAGQWACTSVIAAVRYLSRLPYINVKKLGIQGHSLGAGETNFILTHTRTFAAAAEMAGPTDPVSAYLTLLPAGDPGLETRESQFIWERGQEQIGANLWQRPDLYLRESAVLHADRIGTPLLIVHNPLDQAVQVRQGVELFVALRRLAKPAWLLQYPGEDHFMMRRRDAFDYTQRLMDFFDHFLRDSSLPAWMEPHR